MTAEIGWTDQSEAHVARHGITAADVEQALRNRPQRQAPGREDTTLTYGQTDSGRYLLVVRAEGDDGRTVIVTARTMNPTERQAFRRKGR